MLGSCEEGIGQKKTFPLSVQQLGNEVNMSPARTKDDSKHADAFASAQGRQRVAGSLWHFNVLEAMQKNHED